ncbi:MAG: hypothetical protein K8L99_15065 [Anaerolineae bacterium]|nr:hypothetical protein [Anaerolineae bacterium]
MNALLPPISTQPRPFVSGQTVRTDLQSCSVVSSCKQFDKWSEPIYQMRGRRYLPESTLRRYNEPLPGAWLFMRSFKRGDVLWDPRKREVFVHGCHGLIVANGELVRHFTPYNAVLVGHVDLDDDLTRVLREMVARERAVVAHEPEYGEWVHQWRPSW